MKEPLRIPYDAIYARQSIEKADSISVESQIEFCVYEARGTPFSVYADKGYSGKNTDRPEFRRMLADIRSGRVRRVICYKLDRISRSILDFAALIEEFQKYGVEFVSCTERFDTSTPIGRAMLSICIVFAQLERETIQQRVTDAYRSRSRKGFYMGGRIPFGFRLATCYIEGKRTSCYEIEDEEAKILRLIYNRYAESSASLGTVLQSLRSDGIQNPREENGLWHKSSVAKLLANPIYVKADLEVYRYYKENHVLICNEPRDFAGKNGCYLYTENEHQKCVVIAPHKGIIESETWLRCRKKHRHSPVLAGDSDSERSFLSGKLRCAGCGYSLSITSTRRKNGKNYRYIVCGRAHGTDRTCLGLRGWRLEDAEQMTAVVLKAYLGLFFGKIADITMDRNQKQRKLDITITQLQCEIEKAAAKALETDLVLKPYMSNHIQKLESQKKALLRRRCLNNTETETILLEPDYEQLWDVMSQADKKYLTDLLMDHISLSSTDACFCWRL